jgi:hypothetical protein
MVLFEWERESNKPVQCTENNLTAWEGYEKLRDRFWAEIDKRTPSESKRFMQILWAKHTHLERSHGGYLFRTLNDTVDEVIGVPGDNRIFVTHHILPR